MKLTGHQLFNSQHKPRGIPGRVPRCQAATQQTAQLQLKTEFVNVPHPDKADFGGEDAFFSSDISGGVVGVADGVGGWSSSGISAADYSRSLMTRAEQHLNKMYTIPTTEDKTAQDSQSTPPALPEMNCDTLKEALDVAHRKTMDPGSSTALLLALNKETNTLEGVNVGDCKFIVVRDGKLIAESRIQQHQFDMPFQLALCPDFAPCTDTAYDGQEYHIDVQEGDVVVIATDGLWDNVYMKDLVPLLPNNIDDLAPAAKRMADVASTNAVDEEFVSPYSQSATQSGVDLPMWQKVMGAKFKDGKIQLMGMEGGKVDDITIGVSIITKA